MQLIDVLVFWCSGVREWVVVWLKFSITLLRTEGVIVASHVGS
jgi:hypothetical protein